MGAAGAAAGGGAGGAAAEVDDEWSDELANLVLRQMVLAFDNYAPSEVEGMLAALVDAAGGKPGAYDERESADAERSLRKLAALSRSMERLEAAAASARPEDAADEARTLRSQIRMWGKDGERYMRDARGEPATWLGWLRGLEKGL